MWACVVPLLVCFCVTIWCCVSLDFVVLRRKYILNSQIEIGVLGFWQAMRVFYEKSLYFHNRLKRMHNVLFTQRAEKKSQPPSQKEKLLITTSGCWTFFNSHIHWEKKGNGGSSFLSLLVTTHLEFWLASSFNWGGEHGVLILAYSFD